VWRIRSTCSPKRCDDGSVVSDLGSLVDRLESIVADLDELAFERLSAAAADGAMTRPADDKELVKARRAVEKAAHILRQLDDPASGDQTT
jgi:hypothetical protein